MTITIHLTLEEEAQLLERAKRQKQPPEGVAHSLVHQGLFAPPVTCLEQTSVPDEAHEALVQSLLDTGLMTERPTRSLGSPPPPIVVKGRPVSETLLEERG